MELSEKFKNNLHQVLKDLIKKKSLRDEINFTAYQLAKELDIPRSVISSLINLDEKKRVTNPRVGTLLKIVNYFRAEGFDLSVESLLGIVRKTDFVKDTAVYYYAEREVLQKSIHQVKDIFLETSWLEC